MNDQNDGGVCLLVCRNRPNISSNQLVQEIDNKLLLSVTDTNNIHDPQLLAIIDLMLMRQRSNDDSRLPFTGPITSTRRNPLCPTTCLYTYLLGAWRCMWKRYG